MSKAVFSDFRRDSNGEPIELLKYAPSKEKLCTNGGDDCGLENTKPECKPQLTDHPKNGGVRSHQDGGSDEDKGPTFAKRLSSDPRRTSFEQRRLQNYFYKFLEQPRGWHNVYHVILWVAVLLLLFVCVSFKSCGASRQGSQSHFTKQTLDCVWSHFFVVFGNCSDGVWSKNSTPTE